MVLDVVKRGEESEPLSDELAQAIKALWTDRNVREKAYPRGREFQLVENSKQLSKKMYSISIYFSSDRSNGATFYGWIKE